MGWHCPAFGLRVYARLDEHGGEKEERHAELWADLVARAKLALGEIADDPKYAEISAEVWD